MMLTMFMFACIFVVKIMKASRSNSLKINFVHLKSCLKDPRSQNSASEQILKEGGNKGKSLKYIYIFKIRRNKRTMPFKMRKKEKERGFKYQANDITVNIKHV